jgi:hypothetical protein
MIREWVFLEECKDCSVCKKIRDRLAEIGITGP